jgi:hypothetical protein
MAVGEAPTTNRAAAVTRPYNGHRELRGESTVPAHPSTAQCLLPYHATLRAQNRPRRRGGVEGFQVPLGTQRPIGDVRGLAALGFSRRCPRSADRQDRQVRRWFVSQRRPARGFPGCLETPLSLGSTHNVRRADARFIGRTHTGSHWQQCFLLWRKHPYVASVSSFPFLFTQRGQKHRRRLFKYPTAPQPTTLFLLMT